MSKKDYKLIGSVLKIAKGEIERKCVGDDLLPAIGAWTITVKAVAGALAIDNNTFKEDKFLEACGVTIP